MRDNGVVHRRESVGTGPASRPKSSSKGAAFSCMNHHEPFFVRLSLPTPTIIYYTGGPVLIVIMCYTLSTIIIIGGKIL